MRGIGVLGYLIIFVLASIGLLQLYRTRPQLALVSVFYAVGYTVLYLPLVMDTRLRIPLMEPVLTLLAGGGWAWVQPRLLPWFP